MLRKSAVKWTTINRQIMGAMLLALLTFTGCGAEISSKDELLARLFAECRRSQSRMTPAPMRLSTLQGIVSEPHDIVQLDEKQQKWQYHFADGTVEFTVMVEPDHHWTDEDPRVFVNLRALAEQEGL